MPPTELRPDLLDAARAARANAYAPYSNFGVGAAVLTRDGAVVVGCNVENASFGLSLCAERVAIARAVAEGHRNFRALAIAGPDGNDAMPCGACRQFAAEFSSDMSVTYTTRDGVVTTTLAELLPRPFTVRSLP